MTTAPSPPLKTQTQKKRSPAQARQELRSHPAVRSYTLVCLSALFLLVVCLADRGLGWLCLIPAFIGGLALLFHWSLGPPMVIVSLTGLLLASARYRRSYPYWARDQVPSLMDLLLCVAVLGYVMGHYRLLSLMRHIFPPDPRRSADRTRTDSAMRRPADPVNGREMALLILALPFWTVFSVVVWSWMMDSAPALEIPVKVWRTLCVGWAVLTVLAITSTVVGYLRWTTATPEESRLYLQDQLWRSTRREQGSLNRWLVWARLRPTKEGEIMRYWWRELGGWLLLILGLLCFLAVWQFCKRHYIVEAWPVAIIGIVIFWGGIHLLKVAIAARICQQAQDRLYPAGKTKE